jgi:hypothetical protein
MNVSKHYRAKARDAARERAAIQQHIYPPIYQSIRPGLKLLLEEMRVLKNKHLQLKRLHADLEFQYYSFLGNRPQVAFNSVDARIRDRSEAAAQIKFFREINDVRDHLLRSERLLEDKLKQINHFKSRTLPDPLYPGRIGLDVFDLYVNAKSLSPAFFK